MTNYEQMAEQMYSAYCQQAGGLTFDGKPLPSFQELGLERQTCWKAAAEANFTPQQQADALDAKRALLTVRLTSFPESNGKRNWTAQFVRAKPWKGLVGSAGGITIAHGELWNRVAYEAERARFLIGERDTEPHIRDYGTDIQTPEEWPGEGKERAAIAAAKENK